MYSKGADDLFPRPEFLPAISANTPEWPLSTRSLDRISLRVPLYSLFSKLDLFNEVLDKQSIAY